MTSRLFLFLFFFFSLGAFAANEDLDIEKDIKDLQKNAEQATKKLEQAQKAMEGHVAANPITKLSTALTNNPSLLKALEKIITHPERNRLLAYQGIFAIAYFILRFLVGLMVEGFLWRLLLKIPFLLLFWGGMFYALPLWVLGKPYQHFIDLVRKQIGF